MYDARSKRSNTKFHNALRTHTDRFVWGVLDEAEDILLDTAETKAIFTAKQNGIKLYNHTDGGDGQSKGYKPTDETRAKLGRHRVKTYILRSPNGDILEITNMRQFCLQYGYIASHLHSVLAGRKKSAYGYTKP